MAVLRTLSRALWIFSWAKAIAKVGTNLNLPWRNQIWEEFGTNITPKVMSTWLSLRAAKTKATLPKEMPPSARIGAEPHSSPERCICWVQPMQKLVARKPSITPRSTQPGWPSCPNNASRQIQDKHYQQKHRHNQFTEAYTILYPFAIPSEWFLQSRVPSFPILIYCIVHTITVQPE